MASVLLLTAIANFFHFIIEVLNGIIDIIDIFSVFAFVFSAHFE
jgi:hypothetical protein